jgi:glutathione S-transferase
MILYSFPASPNTRRIAIYLKEKGLTPPYEEIVVDLQKGEHQTSEFLAMNPAGKVPVLKTDDGTLITQSLPIVEYLEELYPAPPMIGATAEERAHVRSVERFIDMEIMGTMGIMAQQKMPLYVERFGSSNDVIHYGRARQSLALDQLEATLGDKPFMAGDQVTIADCTLFAIYEFAFLVDAPLTEKHPRLQAWHDRFSRRPSVALSNEAQQDIDDVKKL